MDQPAHKLGFSFQTKVLVPVLAVLILLPAVTLWIVDHSITQQVLNEARLTLTTTETVFRQTLDVRARDLQARFSNAVTEFSYSSLAESAVDDTHYRETVRKFLKDRLEAYGDDYDALVLAPVGIAPQVAIRHDGSNHLEEWVKITEPLARLAMQDEAQRSTLEFHGRVYLVVSVPIHGSDKKLVGTLTVASSISEAVLQELKSLTGAEISLVADNAITVSSLPSIDRPTLLSAIAQPASAGGAAILPVLIHAEHYLALSDNYERTGPGGGFHFVLLSSYEQRLRELERTRATLLGVSFTVILVSGLFIWFLIGRITHPLVELRDNAVAVGRGDFTRRISRFSNDECGAVAVAFNSMTDNLQASRAELEQAVGSLKTTQAQLIQSEKLSAVGQFVAGVAHELNNPLTSVIGFADLLQHTELESKYQSYVDHIAKNATRCHKIVNSLLGFSRQHEPERKPVRLNELADAVLEIVSYDLRTSNIAVTKEYQPSLPPILGDSHQLQQVVLNILSNARQAMEAFRRDGLIVLRTGSTDTHVWLRIKDNGPGIPREILSRIFDPFFTTKPQGKGTGLGLSLSYGIMQEHRGRIVAESQPGEGTEFILELPIAGPELMPATIRPASAPPFKSRIPSLYVLVIDDEESILQLVQEVLRAEGHRVESATSGVAALELIDRNRYDVIISDWKMPGLNGINLFQELLVKDPSAAKRMLFMTGDVIKNSFQEFLRTHNRTCLPKPFALREFHAAIAQIVNVR